MGSCIRAATVAEGIKFGLEAKVSIRGEKRILEIFDRYKQWILDYHGAMPALNIAAGINHESHGDPLSTSDKKIQECGLWSILGSSAENQDLDPFDPEVNIWMGARLRNQRVARILNDDRYNWLMDAEPYDYTKIMWTLPGSLGMGGWRRVMGWVFKRFPAVGSTDRIRPYHSMRLWFRRNVRQLQAKMDAGERIGRMTIACVACRVVRTSTVDWLKEKGSLSYPVGINVVEAPYDFPEFDEDVYRAIWRTPKSKRHEKFPQYLRTP